MEIQITNKAKKEIARLEKKIQNRVFTSLEKFINQPETVDLKKIQGLENTWRLRVGDYRIIMEIYYQDGIAYVMSVRHRKEVYR